MCEIMLRDVCRFSGLSGRSLRYFNAAGADPDGDLAELHVPETHLIPLAILAATGRHPPIQVFGESVGTPDGTCIRDYVHVADLARGHVQALDHLKLNAGYDAFNFGSERGYSILEDSTEFDAPPASPCLLHLPRQGKVIHPSWLLMRGMPEQ